MLLILLSVFLGAGAQILFKIGITRSENTVITLQAITGLILSPYILIGLSAFAVSFLLWLKILTVAPLSYAYPMLSLGYVLIFLAAWFILGEALPPLRLVGMFFIITGICLVAGS